jgi:hypothetical protein
MDWTTLLAYFSGSVNEDRLLRNKQPASHGQGRGCRVGDRLVMDAAGFRRKFCSGGMKGQVAPVCGRLRQLGSRIVVPCSAL